MGSLVVSNIVVLLSTSHFVPRIFVVEVVKLSKKVENG